MLSASLDSLSPRYHVVVVGSGYGGAICAARLAQAGLDVALVERGREFTPGTFPDRLLPTLSQMQEHARTRLGSLDVGNPLALVEFHLNPELDVMVGNGLGGTSLVNANVCSEPDPRLFTLDDWPAAVRALGATGLETYFARARDMLGAVPYPGDEPAKMTALREAAPLLPMADFQRPPIAVNFTVDGPNRFGVEQHPCIRCGDCILGCNYRAKNTLDYNYLPLAAAHGARIFTQLEVRHVERDGDGDWRLELLPRDVSGNAQAVRSVAARAVVLAAGVLGTVGILLRSRLHGLPMSDMIGQRLSGNGNSITHGYDCDRVTHAVGLGGAVREADHVVGPTITGRLDLRGNTDCMSGLTIEEASFPSGIAGAWARLLALISTASGEPTEHGMRAWLRRVADEGHDLVGDLMGGALERTMAYLAVGHDSSDGRVVLDDDGRVRIEWPGLGDEEVFKSADAVTKLITARHAGVHIREPLWTFFGHNLMTVHPLGGCAMADDPSRGVVDDRGRVYRGAGDARVHDGLYVADGSVIPRSLGINPLLTISAFAERIAEGIVADLQSRE